MSDRWEGIDSFAAVAEMGSFTRAAAKLGISISQVSREVSRLEQRLSTQLLVRTTRRISITEAGKQFEERCQRLIAERDAAFAAAASAEAGLTGHIRFTCPVAYGEEKIVPLINRFVARYPAISIDIELTNRLLDISSEGFDLAIRIDGKADERLGRVRLASRRLHCCSSPAYVDRHGAPSDVNGLDDHRCLQGSSEHWRFTVGGHDVQIRPRARWRCNSGFAVLEAARSGLGICQLPDFYVAQRLDNGELVEVLADFRPRDQDIDAVYPLRPRQSPKVAALIDFIRQGL